MLIAFHHLSLSVTDVDRSAAWYGALFGFAVTADFEGDGFRRVRMRLDEPGITLTLTGHHDGSGDRFDERRTGMDHVSFQVGSVADVEAVARRCAELGAEHSALKPADRGPNDRAMITLRDPDHIQLEVACFPD